MPMTSKHQLGPKRQMRLVDMWPPKKWIVINSSDYKHVSVAEIVKGDVKFFKNSLLCHETSVNWRDILMGEKAKVEINETEIAHKTHCK